MDFGALFQVVMYQLVTARDAPYPIALAALVAALVTWALTRWWYVTRTAKLKQAIARRDGDLAKLRAHAPAVGDGAEAGEDAAARRAAPRSAERRTLRLIVNTIDQAELALRSDDAREADRALSSMALALQAVQSSFDLPVPVLEGVATANLRTGKAYLERVRPALRAGDAEAAREAAEAFLAGAGKHRASAARVSA